MKSVLISIQPKWCELIASGKKTIEVRKTRPKIEPPFKCYIYCTVGKGNTGDILPQSSIVCGKVIGDYVCSRIDKFMPDRDYYGLFYDIDYDTLRDTCLTTKDLSLYGKGKPLFGLHISDLEIYDKPRELSEFWIAGKCPFASKHGCTYKYHCFRVGEAKKCGEILTRPPQSWCYVEEVC